MVKSRVEALPAWLLGRIVRVALIGMEYAIRAVHEFAAGCAVAHVCLDRRRAARIEIAADETQQLIF